jgi:hypothetical protein
VNLPGDLFMCRYNQLHLGRWCRNDRKIVEDGVVLCVERNKLLLKSDSLISLIPDIQRNGYLDRNGEQQQHTRA